MSRVATKIVRTEKNKKGQLQPTKGIYFQQIGSTQGKGNWLAPAM
jgi:hypothetical protein